MEAWVLVILPFVSTTDVGESSEDTDVEAVGMEPAPAIVCWSSEEDDSDMRVEGDEASEIDEEQVVVMV